MLHQVTFSIPESIYQQIQFAAEKTHRSINEVITEAVLAVAPIANTTTAKTRGELAHLAYLSDAALWQCARSTMIVEQRKRLEELHDEADNRALTLTEQNEEKALLALYHDMLMVRAQAAVILKNRGYDVSDPTQFAPLT